jgi:hypothetical protein
MDSSAQLSSASRLMSQTNKQARGQAGRQHTIDRKVKIMPISRKVWNTKLSIRFFVVYSLTGKLLWMEPLKASPASTAAWMPAQPHTHTRTHAHTHTHTHTREVPIRQHNTVQKYNARCHSITLQEYPRTHSLTHTITHTITHTHTHTHTHSHTHRAGPGWRRTGPRGCAAHCSART